MDAGLAEFKRQLLDTGLFMKVSTKGQYRCKTCPFCGDTGKHMYVKIDQDSDMPVVYYCQKCNAHGLMKQDWLDYFGIDDIKIPKIKGNRKIQSQGVGEQIVELIDFEKDSQMIQTCKDYIQQRVGIIPSNEDLKSFRCIGNVFDYVNAYLGGEPRGLKNRVWFCLHNGNIAGRRTDDIDSFRWVKRNRNNNNKSGGIYVIKRPIDTMDTINVCICEGIMDAIGLYYHAKVKNAVFIACLGRDYQLGIKYVIDSGIFGESVNIRIYKDADVNEVFIDRIYKKIFKSISVYKNAIGKDYGVLAEQIEIEKSI